LAADSRSNLREPIESSSLLQEPRTRENKKNSFTGLIWNILKKLDENECGEEG
jgi:hypothetical protein